MMKKRTLTIATRKSLLALWQAEFIRGKLLALWPNLRIELLPMSTSGDKFNKTKLLEVGGKGLFVKELEEAILDHRADLAVHSMKDVPAEFPKGLGLTAIYKRDNPLDAFVSPRYATINDLPKAAVIGTASLRRQSQLLAYRPDLQIKTLRGNIHTRLQKMKDEHYDAIILAAAGLERMEMNEQIAEMISPDLMLPACGQGALGIECRTDDLELQQLLSPLNDPLTALCVNAERLVNATLGGNCHVPLAVYCTLSENKTHTHLKAKVCSEDGQIMIESEAYNTLEETLKGAEACAQDLLNKGADKLLGLKP